MADVVHSREAIPSWFASENNHSIKIFGSGLVCAIAVIVALGAILALLPNGDKIPLIKDIALLPAEALYPTVVLSLLITFATGWYCIKSLTADVDGSTETTPPPGNSDTSSKELTKTGESQGSAGSKPTKKQITGNPLAAILEDKYGKLGPREFVAVEVTDDKPHFVIWQNNDDGKPTCRVYEKQQEWSAEILTKIKAGYSDAHFCISQENAAEKLEDQTDFFALKVSANEFYTHDFTIDPPLYGLVTPWDGEEKKYYYFASPEKCDAFIKKYCSDFLDLSELDKELREIYNKENLAAYLKQLNDFWRCNVIRIGGKFIYAILISDGNGGFEKVYHTSERWLDRMIKESYTTEKGYRDAMYEMNPDGLDLADVRESVYDKSRLDVFLNKNVAEGQYVKARFYADVGPAFYAIKLWAMPEPKTFFFRLEGLLEKKKVGLYDIEALNSRADFMAKSTDDLKIWLKYNNDFVYRDIELEKDNQTLKVLFYKAEGTRRFHIAQNYDDFIIANKLAEAPFPKFHWIKDASLLYTPYAQQQLSKNQEAEITAIRQKIEEQKVNAYSFLDFKDTQIYTWVYGQRHLSGFEVFELHFETPEAREKYFKKMTQSEELMFWITSAKKI